MAVLSPESLAIYPSRVGDRPLQPLLRSRARFSSLAERAAGVRARAPARTRRRRSAGPRERNDLRRTSLEQIIQFKVANKPETSTNEVAAPRCNQQGPFSVQRPERASSRTWSTRANETSRRLPVPLRASSTSRPTPTTGDWSIRCMDVHKRLGGVPVLNGLNVAFPDDTITVVLGPSGTGKSVLIKHLIGLMFPDSGDIVVHGQSVPSLTMPKLLALRRKIGVLFQDGALFGSMSRVRQRRLPAAPAHRHVRGGDRRARHAAARRRGAGRCDGRRALAALGRACASAPGSRARW